MQYNSQITFYYDDIEDITSNEIRMGTRQMFWRREKLVRVKSIPKFEGEETGTAFTYLATTKKVSNTSLSNDPEGGRGRPFLLD